MVAHREERFRNHGRPLTFLGRQPRVSRTEGKAVVIAHGRHSDHVAREIQVSVQAPDDGQLLEIFLAEVRARGSHDREELGHHGGYAGEMSGADRAFPTLGQSRHAHGGRESLRVQDLLGRREDDRNPGVRSQSQIPFEGARIGLQILRLIELQRIDEDAGDRHIVFGCRAADQFQMSVVERPHGRDQPGRYVPEQVTQFVRSSGNDRQAHASFSSAANVSSGRCVTWSGPG